MVMRSTGSLVTKTFFRDVVLLEPQFWHLRVRENIAFVGASHECLAVQVEQASLYIPDVRHSEI